jgi:hypothetical protein
MLAARCRSRWRREQANCAPNAANLARRGHISFEQCVRRANAFGGRDPCGTRIPIPQWRRMRSSFTNTTSRRRGRLAVVFRETQPFAANAVKRPIFLNALDRTAQRPRAVLELRERFTSYRVKVAARHEAHVMDFATTAPCSSPAVVATFVPCSCCALGQCRRNLSRFGFRPKMASPRGKSPTLGIIAW